MIALYPRFRATFASSAVGYEGAVSDAMSPLPTRPIVTVGALACAPDGRFLVVRTHKWRDSWGVPGGKIDPGEAMEAALVREFREETGLSVRDVRFVAVYDAIDSPEFYKPGVHMVLLNYVCACDGGDVTLSDEAEEYRWVTPAEARALPLNSFTRRLLQDAEAAGLMKPAG